MSLASRLADRPGTEVAVAKVFGPGTPASFRQGEEASQMTPASPFSPGTPIGPYDGYDRTPRAHDFTTGYNIATRPRTHERVSFETLQGLIQAYDVAEICLWHRIDSIRSLKWKLLPADHYLGDVTDAVPLGVAALRKPDRKNFFKTWIAKYAYDILAYDAGTLYRLRNRAGKAVGLSVIDGKTVAPLLDYWGNSPEPPAEAYVQYVNGLPWNWLTRDDIIYEPFRPRPDSPYGHAPIESIILNANCYSDDTEVLTDRGWLRFAETDISSDRFATRNPATAAFEWQAATRYHEADSGGTMYRAASRNADLLVTGGHRLLVDRLPRGCPGVRHGSEWLVHAGDLYEYQSALPGGGAGVRCPATSTWNAPDLECFTLPVSPCDFVRMDAEAVRNARGTASLLSVEARASQAVTRPTLRHAEQGRRLRRSSAEAVCEIYGLPRSVIREDAHYFSERIDGDDFAAFMGMYLSEGCVRPDGPNITIAQEEFSKGYVEFRDLLARMLGREAPYHRGAFTFGHTALADYLRPFGKAHEKWIPREVLGMSRRQLEIFWHFYVLGDGHILRDGAGHTRTETVTTCSKRLADGLQEVLQKIGISGAVRPVGKPAKPTHHQRWQVQTRFQPANRINVERVPYEGKVYCVSVPNKTLYVRRNGYPAWCANTDIRFQLYFLQRFTEGNLPAAFASAPESWSPDQIEQFQAFWDSYMYGNQEGKHQVRWMPPGSKFVWSNEKDFTDTFSLFLMRKTCASFHVVPSDLGFTEDVNRSSGESQADVQHRVGDLPFMEHIEGILSAFLYDDLGLPLKFEFDRGEEQVDQLAQAQADQAYMDRAVVSPSEIREMRYGLTDSTPIPRAYFSERQGPIPVNSLLAVAGPVDPQTAAPEPGTPLPHAAFTEVEGVIPNPALPGEPLAEQEYGPKALPPGVEPVAKDGEAAPGITSETGIYGDPLIRDDEDEDRSEDERAAAVRKELADFRSFRQRRRKAGKWHDFEFRAVDPVRGHNLNDYGRLCVRKAAGEIAVAGLAVLAVDTGRVLMLQRALCDDDPAAGKLEFPGGHLDGTETPLQAAWREFCEETGCPAPPGMQTGTWTSADGIYQGIVWTTESEASVPVRGEAFIPNPDDPDGDAVEAVMWVDPSDLPGNPMVRAELAADLPAVMAALGCAPDCCGGECCQGDGGCCGGSGGCTCGPTGSGGGTPSDGDESVCPCGTPVVYDEMNGWQHADGSVSHDDGESVSDKMGAVAKAAEADPKGRSWPGWSQDLKAAEFWASSLIAALTGIFSKALADHAARAYLEAFPPGQQDGDGKRERTEAAAAWLTDWLSLQGIDLMGAISPLMTGMMADGWLIGAVSAQSVTDGSDADWGGWRPGDTDAAQDRSRALLGAAAGPYAAGGSVVRDAQEMAAGFVTQMGRALAGGALAGIAAAALGDALYGALADQGYAQGSVLTQILTAAGAAVMALYRKLKVQRVRWETDPASNVCPECAANEQGSPYKITNAPDCPAHIKCRCAVVPA